MEEEGTKSTILKSSLTTAIVTMRLKMNMIVRQEEEGGGGRYSS